MELHEFVKRFLPDYEKLKEMYIGTKLKPSSFCITHFPEAIKNFTDKICQDQRIICAEVYDDFNPGGAFYLDIERAEQPKIEDIP